MTEKLIKSKQRVSDFGEVFTPAHIVKDMWRFSARRNVGKHRYNVS